SPRGRKYRPSCFASSLLGDRIPNLSLSLNYVPTGGDVLQFESARRRIIVRVGRVARSTLKTLRNEFHLETCRRLSRGGIDTRPSNPVRCFRLGGHSDVKLNSRFDPEGTRLVHR